MIYTFILMDKPQSAELRQRVRPEHKAYLAGMADAMAFAGPFTADDGVTMIGSCIHAFVNLWPQKAGFPKAV